MRENWVYGLSLVE